MLGLLSLVEAAEAESFELLAESDLEEDSELDSELDELLSDELLLEA